MHEKYNKEILDLIRSMQNIDYINPEDIPDIDLYMDQVTTFMDEHLKSCLLYTSPSPRDP